MEERSGIDDVRSPNGPPLGFMKMLDWLEKALIDYADIYTKLYTAYNAWYGEITGLKNDRSALTALKKRFVIWEEYQAGKCMAELQPYMTRLAELTQREPLRVTHAHWNGELADADDWRSLIEYWYQVRCLVVHGEHIETHYVYLAYETLLIFMKEIVKRTRKCLAEYSFNEGHEREYFSQMAHSGPVHSEKFLHLRQKLYIKYVALPNVWEVDMTPT